MKKFLLAMLAVWAGAALAQTPEAPPGPGPGGHHETPAQRMEHLAILLDLTDSQKVQVQTILQEEHAKVKALFDQAQASGTKPSFDQIRTLHEQVQQDTITKLTPVLSPAQLKKFQILMQERGPMGRGHHGPPAEEGSQPPQ